MAKITVKELEALSRADAGRILRDGENLNGVVKSRADGVSVLYRWRYRFDGKVKDYTCGTWPKESMAAIRAEQKKARAVLDAGKDPAEERRVVRLEATAEQAEALGQAQARIEAAAALQARLTVSELFEKWAATELVKRKDGGKEARRSFTKDVLPVLGDVAVEEVKRGMIAALLDDVKQRAPIVARELLGDMRQMFNYAIKREIIESNPTALLKRDDFGVKVERERILTDAEIRMLPGKLADARMAESNVAAIWIMLSTCCRVGEISQAEWKDIDLEAMTWRIPAANSKNAKEHTIMLSAFAAHWFEALQTMAEGSQWVLPARWTDKHVCLKSLAKLIGDRQRGDKAPMACRCKQTNALELPGGKWTPHDLRRTGATLMGQLGVRPDVIEKALNHVQQNKLVRIYQRQEMKEEQAEAWRLLGERLELLTREDADNVIPIRRDKAMHH
jgi:integrase